MENFRLKVFRTVAEKLNFRQAAESLYLTQPAVTLQIKALEDELGVQLFNRSGNRIALTEAGGILFTHAGQIAALVMAAQAELGKLKGEELGDLRIGASTTIAQYVLPPLLGDFQLAQPGIRLSVLGANTAVIVAGVLDGNLALGLIEGPSLRRDLKIERFLADEIGVITPAHHEWAGQTISPEQLAKERLILREEGSGTRRVVETALRRAGVRMKQANIVMVLDSTEAIKSAVETGLGIGFVARRAIRKELKLGTLNELTVRGMRIERNFSIVLPRGPEPGGPPGAFLRFLRAVRNAATQEIS
jgi:DNA-binding transcriptional LysR family regulator